MLDLPECKHKGHNQLAVRGVLTVCQACVNVVLIVHHVDNPHKSIMVDMQLWAAVTLFLQWWTGSSYCFPARAVSGILRALLTSHAMVCGRKWSGLYWWQPLTFSGSHDAHDPHDCATEGWTDMRMAFRILHLCAAMRFLGVATSLILQFLYPERGVTETNGNEQLYYRALIKATGVPIQVLRGLLKIVLLSNTPFERLTVEIVMNFVLAALTACNSTSLYVQYRTSGTAGPPPGGFRQVLCDSESTSSDEGSLNEDSCLETGESCEEPIDQVMPGTPWQQSENPATE